MRDESAVWQALLRRKGLSMSDLASRLGLTRRHAHRLLTGRRPAESQRPELEAALALGIPTGGRPLFAIGELDDNGELDLVPAGDAQPLFRDRELATLVASRLAHVSQLVCMIPVWPATRGATWSRSTLPGERNPSRGSRSSSTSRSAATLEALVEEIRTGPELTLVTRAQAHDPASLAEVEVRLQRLN